MAALIAKKYRAYRERLREEFRAHVEALLENEQVQLLDSCRQHYKYTRLRHSMDVAYISFVIARVLGFDSRSAARAGLLHDLFFEGEGERGGSMLFSHPRIALENARQVCVLNRVEEDIILKHMFLLTPWPPRYKEGYIVTLVDKYCATKEFLQSAFTRRKVLAAQL